MIPGIARREYRRNCYKVSMGGDHAGTIWPVSNSWIIPFLCCCKTSREGVFELAVLGVQGVSLSRPNSPSAERVLATESVAGLCLCSGTGIVETVHVLVVDPRPLQLL